MRGSSSNSNPPRTRFLWVVWILASAAVIGIQAPAYAQGTMGAVPDPITSRELTSYGDRLKLSAQQRQAIESLHDQYREEFRLLRENDIEKLLNESRGMERSPFAFM